MSYYPKIRALTTAIPNAGKRSLAHGKMMKDEGLTKGFCDLCMFIPKAPYHGLLIEFKVGKNKLTSEQQEKIRLLNAQNYRAVICYTLEEAMAVTKEYLGDLNVI